MRVGIEIWADDEAAARDLARSLSPSVAYPLLVAAGVLPLVHLSLLGAVFGGWISMWAATLPLGISAYLHYTLVHEAIHRNIAPGRGWGDRFNGIIGWIGSLVLGSTWPLFRRTHIAHHRFTNTDRDPDSFVQGSLVRLLLLWMVALFINLLPIVPMRGLSARLGLETGYLDAEPLMPAREWRQHVWIHGLLCALVWGGVLLGHGAAVFALYVLPAGIGRLLVGVLLAWLPHVPFSEYERYRNTRIKRFPFSRWICTGQDLHLVHHLHPSVPVYHYPRFFRAMEPFLRQRGARIDD